MLGAVVGIPEARRKQRKVDLNSGSVVEHGFATRLMAEASFAKAQWRGAYRVFGLVLEMLEIQPSALARHGLE